MINQRGRRKGRRARLSLAALAALLIGSLLAGGTAHAAGVTLASAVSIEDGTAPFDGLPGPGLQPGFDNGPDNHIVRTNDNLTYQLSVAPSATVTNTTFTVVLPQGEEMTGVPGVCTGPGSQVVPATLPPPTLPTTVTSYRTLPRQTLTCNVGTVRVGSSLRYPVVAKVRGEVPNGALLVLGPTDVTVTADNATPTSPTPPAPIVVSARAQFDLSKDGIADDPDHGYFGGPGTYSCSNDKSRVCQVVEIPILISVPPGGRGSTPLASPLTFTEDLSPASLYPPGYDTNPNWVAAGPNALAKYGAVLYSPPNGCGSDPIYASPGPKIGLNGSPNFTAENSVRDSGTLSCIQPGGPGTPVTVTIVNPDTTALTCPSLAIAPAGYALPADRCYVISGQISYEVPVAAIKDLGIASGGKYSFATTDYFRNFTPTAIDGTPNVPEPLVNNRRNIGYVVGSSGVGYSKTFAGIPGDPQNEPPGPYSGGFVFGPPGAGTAHDGNTPALPGQGVISVNAFSVVTPPGPGPTSVLTCDSWDNSKLWLKAANYPGSQTGEVQGQVYPSGGAAVWLSAFDISSGGFTQFPTVVQYGTGPGGSGILSQCDDSSSPAGWVSDPATLPGNDPAKVATGVYTAVTRVRVYAQVPYNLSSTWAAVSVGQVVADSPGPTGTRVPNWGNAKFDFGGGTFAQMLNPAVAWSPSAYDPNTNAGIYGDRLTIGNDFVRIKKEVRTAGSGGFVTTTPQTSGGQTVDYRLSPTVNSGVPTSQTDDLTVEDCLPVGQSFLVNSASPAPSLVQVGSSPPGAGITCTAGQTYVKWVLPGQTINAAVSPIQYSVRISGTVAPGVETNTALVSSTGDRTSPESARTATANVQITQPSGVAIDKTALTPLVQVNRLGSANNDLLKWRIDFANLNAPLDPQDVDIIDVLPQTGANASSFTGTLALSSVAVTAGSTGAQSVQVLYSANAVVNSNPTDPSNTQGTATNTYCDAASGGTAVIGTGTCPTGLASVRALRLLRPGPFRNGEVITAEVDMLPMGNAKGDVYVNRVGGDTTGLLPVGPLDAPETITARSFGKLVWWDYNKNGAQDPAEPGIANVKINVTGTDDLGNPVTLAVTTNASGNYTVPNLRAGSYHAIVDPSTLPAGAQPVYDLGHGLVGAIGDSLPFTLAQSQDRVDVNFGYRPAPAISTTTSAATGVPGNPLKDAITVMNTQGQAGSVAWQLMGPVTPGPGQTCSTVSYATAPVMGSGTMAVSGDGPYSVGPVTTGPSGCYSWSEVLSGPSYNASATSAAGEALETTLISAPSTSATPPPPTSGPATPTPASPTSTPSPTPTPTPSVLTPGVPNTGAGTLQEEFPSGVFLIVFGAIGMLLSRRLFPGRPYRVRPQP